MEKLIGIMSRINNIMIKTLICIIFVFLLSCDSSQKKELIKETKKNTSKDCFIKLTRLTKKGGDVIGDIYVGSNSRNFFDRVYVINGNDTVYKIENTTLSNKNGIDIKLNSKYITEYRFVMINQDYFILTGLGDGGSHVSDNISINWNYEDEILEFLRTP